MIKNLVIVESPAKAKTIEKFLGSDYKVMSSYGHIRDLKPKSFSIDVEDNYNPIYEIPEDKKELVKDLKKAAKSAQMVWLASDEDREGEAIAWHLYEVLGLKPENTRRIVFHEITKNAILNAIENPRTIDLARVDAQQARRVLDRIVGFELSPVLWKKIKPALSAGRVQSVAVRLIVEREEEIKNFIPEEYFRVTATFTIDGHPVHSELHRRLGSEKEAMELLASCKDADFTVGEIAVKPLSKSPAPPFTTSTLQQDASRKLGLTVSQTMMIAQRLYEEGHITYMRTDSVNLSTLALNAISKEIKENMGEEYLHIRKYHTSSKGAQEAHEAIRPTYISNKTIEGTAAEKRLYNLIWKRTVASQMADAQIEKTTMDIEMSNSQDKFIATGEVIKFDGFLKVYIEGRDDDRAEKDPEGAMLPPVKSGEKLVPEEIVAAQRFTLQPPRYTEASLVKKMEELGIGRPSTYAPTISTIQQRLYVARSEKEGSKRDLDVITLKDGEVTKSVRTETAGSEKGRLVPTDIGIVVNEFLTRYFPDILDYNFTANVEERFDDIAEGKLVWNDEIGRFYTLFHPNVQEVSNMRLEHKVGERQLGVDPASGRNVSVKIGRFGPIVQLGDTDSDVKPQFASLLKGQSVSTITLEEALKLFEFPRTIGELDGDPVVIGVGRFGPYILHQKKYVSIPKGTAPTDITFDEAVELINAKKNEDERRIIKQFENNPDLQVLNGRFGPYIKFKGNNYKLPKTVTEPADLSEEKCMEIVSSQEARPKTGRRTKKA